MYPQLILHSDHPERIALVPPHLRDAHKPTTALGAASAGTAATAAEGAAVAAAGAWAELNAADEDDPPLAPPDADDAAEDAAAAEALLADAGF